MRSPASRANIGEVDFARSSRRRSLRACHAGLYGEFRVREELRCRQPFGRLGCQQRTRFGTTKALAALRDRESLSFTKRDISGRDGRESDLLPEPSLIL